LFAARGIIILYDGFSDEIGRADVAVIPGNKVEENGSPSDRLKARLNGGVKAYRTGFVKKLVVSGAVGREGYDEAEIMKKYLVGEDIPPQDIIMDHQGYTTYETAINCQAILKKNNYHSAMVISQYFHISRTRLALKKSGVEEVYSMHVPYFEFRDVFSLIREIPAYYYYAFRSYPESK
ncbi:MAG: YdcF family protein, partial [Cytophagaceae bacterium]